MAFARFGGSVLERLQNWLEALPMDAWWFWALLVVVGALIISASLRPSRY